MTVLWECVIWENLPASREELKTEDESQTTLRVKFSHFFIQESGRAGDSVPFAAFSFSCMLVAKCLESPWLNDPSFRRVLFITL